MCILLKENPTCNKLLDHCLLWAWCHPWE